MVDRGKFQIYPRIRPILTAGLWRFGATQPLTADPPAGASQAEELPVEPLATHVRVRSPQYVLPPDQLLSTFPPAGREGSFGMTLPQVVIKRRTLPWERDVNEGAPTATTAPEHTPWLALVVIAPGEAAIKLNQPVAACLTSGVTFEPPLEVETADCLEITAATVRRIFPTQEEVALLAHAREVDNTDTEQMMGDDDGFLSVVVANRLPLAGRDAEGHAVPVTWSACLVNLCGQWDSLLDKAPVQDLTHTLLPLVSATRVLSLQEHDLTTMDVAGPAIHTGALPKAADETTRITRTQVDGRALTSYVGSSGWGMATDASSMAEIRGRMADPFLTADVAVGLDLDRLGVLNPTLRFPLLAHWSFTTTGDTTFKTLVQALDNGLLGTRPDPAKHAETTGRLPLESTPTGHVGLPHRLRVGDQVRSWYRGPFVPHPTDVTAERLALAHAADQVRTVVPDGREDVSLAAAFEIGRLLGLSRPAMIAAMMRWRQRGFQVARAATGFASFRGFQNLIDRVGLVADRSAGGRLGALVAASIAERPGHVLGPPSPLVTPGRPLFEADAVSGVLATGLGVPSSVLSGSAQDAVTHLRDLAAPVPVDTDVPTAVAQVRADLGPRVSADFSRVALQAIAPEFRDGVIELDADQLPLDVRMHLDPAAGVDGAAFAERLRVAMPKAAAPFDALDVVLADRDEHAKEHGDADL